MSDGSPQKHVHPTILSHARELRRALTPAEWSLWKRLHELPFGFKFRRQQPIGQFIVDFYCSACRLIIEVDGDSHAEQVEYDLKRTEWLVEQGYHVIRFTNRDITHNLDGVLQAIMGECQK